MNYCKAIRKLFNTDVTCPLGTKIEEAAIKACSAGYKLMSFNGRVYQVKDNCHYDTDLLVSDFEV